MSMNKRARIALTVDVEGEWFELPGEQGSFDVKRVIAAVQQLELLLDSIESKIETPIPVTWFIRCDDSVAATTGEASGLLHSLDKFIERRAAKGDEFGLHPHLYRCSEGKWIPEDVPALQMEQIERAAMGWQRFFGLTPRLTRMGEAVMNNTMAKCLDVLGVEIDSSALSSRKRFDNGFQFDWTNTPASPYHPSIEDYRRPANGNESSHRFIEIPFTMLPIKGPQDKESVKRYCNLAFKAELIQTAILSIEKPEFIVAVVHPHELFVNDHEHPLIAYDPTSIEKNITNLRYIFDNIDFRLLSASSHDVVNQHQ